MFNSRYIYFFTLFLVKGILIAQPNTQAISQKINGISFSGPNHPPLTINMFDNVKISNANWIALIPEATLDRKTLQLIPDKENDHWSETIEANIEAIKLAKKAGLKIMLKPHIVLGKKEIATITSYNIRIPSFLNFEDKTRNADWRGDFRASSVADWEIWENSYETYILHLAEIANTYKVDLFCIGTELRESAIHRSLFWRQLIRKVKTIYQGPITYSANWDEYDKITFWNDLDYMGVDTYFPINEMPIPKVKTTIKNWKPILKKIKAFSRKFNKPVLITEFGYRNIKYAGKEPWLHDLGKDQPNNEAQLNLYKAFFEAVWEQPWVAGGFLWQWSYKPVSKHNTDFSPQNKPALQIVQEWYGKK